jgi:prevent-host-death family protein
MRQVGSYEAKTHLPRLLDEVARGETFSITKHGVPVAVLGPVARRSSMTTTEAIAGLRSFRQAHPLAGSSIRDPIDEGRR